MECGVGDWRLRRVAVLAVLVVAGSALSLAKELTVE
jgi:hypothetical protein